MKKRSLAAIGLFNERVLYLFFGDVSIDKFFNDVFVIIFHILDDFELIDEPLTGAYGLSGGVAEATKPIYDAFSTAGVGMTLENQDVNETPYAYLNYIFFNKDYSNSFWGHVSMPSTADTEFKKIAIPGINITEEGYLYVYVSNESGLGACLF